MCTKIDQLRITVDDMPHASTKALVTKVSAGGRLFVDFELIAGAGELLFDAVWDRAKESMQAAICGAGVEIRE